MKIYLANGLFSESDQRYNAYLAELIRQNVAGVELFVPQEQGINDKASYADSVMIARLDKQNLLESDVLVAVLDGVEVDSGVASEVGIFSTTNRPIIGLYTDVRQQGRENNQKILALKVDGTENQFMYRNLMVIGLVKEQGVVLDSSAKLVDELSRIQQEGLE